MSAHSRRHSSGSHRPRPPKEKSVDVLARRSLDLPAGKLPRVVVKTPSGNPLFYRKRIAHADPAAGIGDLVKVEFDTDSPLGYGIYNPRAEISLRMLSWEADPPDRMFWESRLLDACRLREEFLVLPQVTDAYRLIHAEGDNLSGLIVDRYGDVLSAEVFSLAMYQRIDEILDILERHCGTKHRIVRTGPQVHGQEGFLADPVGSSSLPEQVVIQEYGTRFKVRFQGGHKTGFFCDQRENRRELARHCADKTVLDLCSYTGGFAIQAKKLGNAKEVTGVELDEHPLAIAKENAALNQSRVNFVQADIFAYMRDMVQNGRQYDVVLLDPPKLIRSRMEIEQGTRTHFDMNRLALQLVKPGGLFVSCTCAGLLGWEEFLKMIHAASRQAGPQRERIEGEYLKPYRQLQLVDRSGAGGDHPIAMHCPETEYLKLAWMRVV